MNTISTKALAWTVGAVLLASSGPENVPEPAEFAEPVRLKAGDAFLGGARLYPSPVVREVDGRREIVVGDLIGKVTVASLSTGEAGVKVSEEKPFLNSKGEQLKFHNW